MCLNHIKELNKHGKQCGIILCFRPVNVHAHCNFISFLRSFSCFCCTEPPYGSKEAGDSGQTRKEQPYTEVSSTPREGGTIEDKHSTSSTSSELQRDVSKQKTSKPGAVVCYKFSNVLLKLLFVACTCSKNNI